RRDPLQRPVVLAAPARARRVHRLVASAGDRRGAGSAAQRLGGRRGPPVAERALFAFARDLRVGRPVRPRRGGRVRAPVGPADEGVGREAAARGVPLTRLWGGRFSRGPAGETIAFTSS